MAVAKCGPDVDNAQLVSAQAADDLLTIRGNKASFVVSASGSDAAISGRSIGKVNVQVILETLGGGGHATMAAAVLPDTSVEQAYEKLKETIENSRNED